MAEAEFLLDMSKARRRTGRSKRSVRRYWNTRYNAFINAGFSEPEAVWGASEGLSLKNEEVKALIRHRRALVELYMGRHFNMTREEAVEEAAHDLESKLDKAGEDELNLFYEVSP